MESLVNSFENVFPEPAPCPAVLAFVGNETMPTWTSEQWSAVVSGWKASGRRVLTLAEAKTFAATASVAGDRDAFPRIDASAAAVRRPSPDASSPFDAGSPELR